MHAPPHELFIVLDRFRPRYRELLDALAPLAAAADDGPLVSGCHAYYRSDTDVALLAVLFDRRTFGPQKLAWVLSVLESSRLLVLNPDKLRDDDRRTFYDSYLPHYRVRVEGIAGPVAALEELNTLIAATGDERPGGAARASATTVGPPLDDAGGSDRTTIQRQSDRRVETALETPRHHHADDSKKDAGRYQVVRSNQPETLPPTAILARHPDARRRHLTPQAALLPRGKQPRRAGASESAIMPLRVPVRASMPPPQMAALDGSLAPAIDVRFLRGDEWVPARLRSINLRGARVAAGAPPRLADIVQLAVSLRGHDIVLAGSVTQVIDALHADDGSTGFAVTFGDLPSEVRARLVALLTEARDCGLALRPPPSRAAARFPVYWPTRVITSRGELDSAALDISKSGLFLATDEDLGDGEVSFRMPLDLGSGGVAGRGELARHVTGEMASARGLPRGYGVHILDLAPEVAVRWEEFLERVRQRTEKRLVVAARPQRAEALVRSLQGAGYVVTAGSDACTLLEQTDQDPRPPDAALIDVGLADLDPASQRLRKMFNLRHVPCVTIGTEVPERARMVVDHLLHIT